MTSTEMASNAQRIDFTSEVTGSAYRLFVSTPAGEAPRDGWPAIYLIDGNLHFGITVDTARIQERWPDVARAVIVGIGYQTDSVATALQVRTRELTPCVSAEVLGQGWQAAMRSSPSDYGCLDAYLTMVETEVRPHARAAAPINPADEALFGHSLGGLTTLACLFRSPGAFRSYAAISPSIWFSERWVLGHLPAFEAAARNDGGVDASLFLSAGEYEGAEPPFPPIPRRGMPMSEEDYAAMARDCAMVSEVEALAARLEGLPGLRLDWMIHPREDHRTVVPAGIARAVFHTLYRPERA